MMLAYQPVRSLATLNIAVQQGLSGAKRVLPIIDDIPEIQEKNDSKVLNLEKGQINFENVKFEYQGEQKQILNSINLQIEGKK